MYKVCSSKQKTRGALLDELIKRLPEIPAERVKVLEGWYRSHRMFASRRQDINSSFKTMRTAVIDEARTSLNKCIQNTLQNLEQQRLMAMHEQHRKHVHDRLVEMRVQVRQ